MKLVVCVEGYTEKRVIPSLLKRWLDTRLTQPIGVQIDRSEGWRELWDDLPKKARMYLNGPRESEIVGIVGLMDLYGPTIYPGGVTTATDRAAWAKSEIEGRVSDVRFRMFFAVHELEAWLLSDPTLFAGGVKRAIAGDKRAPEAINFDESPSKLLQRLFSQEGRYYKKVVDGGNLFARLNPDTVYRKCPHFQRMMDELLNLAKQAGL